MTDRSAQMAPDGQQWPSSPDAEKACLGAVLIRNDAYYRMPRLSIESFFVPANRYVFAGMVEMAGQDISALTLAAEMRRLGTLDAAGGVAYLTSLMDVVPDVANVERYAEIVERDAKKRAQIRAGYALVSDGFDPASEPEDAAASAMASLGSIATKEDAQARPLVEVLSEAYKAQDGLRERNASISLTSDFRTLDDHKVFTPTFWVCGSPTKHGKSAMMIALSEGLGRNGHPNVMISLESTMREIGLRYTSGITEIPHSRVRDWRTFSERDFAKVAECHKLSSKRPIFITRGIRTAEEIVLEIRRLKAVHGIKAAWIDYIQLVDLKRKVDSREERLAEVAKLFLETAIDSEVHIMAFSQLREGAGKDGARLTVDDLAYAKAIGKSARGVLLFQRPAKGGAQCPECERAKLPCFPCHVPFQIEANNEDRTNDFIAHFDEATQRFTEGTCEENDCRRLRASGPINQQLFK